jgi:DNA-binding NarL/FixJ family response regulator
MSPSHNPVRVFLADDSSLVRGRVAAMLDAGGMAIVGEAETPQSSIDGILGALPDVVVLDVQLKTQRAAGAARGPRRRAQHRLRRVQQQRTCLLQTLPGEGADCFDKSSEFDQLVLAVADASRHPVKTSSEKLLSTILPPRHPVRVMHQTGCSPVAQDGAPPPSAHLCRLGMTGRCGPPGRPDVPRRRVIAGRRSEGDRFQFIYAVRAGTVSSLLLADGRTGQRFIAMDWWAWTEWLRTARSTATAQRYGDLRHSLRASTDLASAAACAR